MIEATVLESGTTTGSWGLELRFPSRPAAEKADYGPQEKDRQHGEH